MRLFQLFATLLFFTFIGIFTLVVVKAYSRAGGSTGMSMAKVQQTRFESEIASP